jgi:Cdc6-like AAA superfamily ATPase
MTASGNIEQEVLLIAGRSGNGKTSVSFEVSDQLKKANVAHCLVDGDDVDTAYPKPAGGPHPIELTEANLTRLSGATTPPSARTASSMGASEFSVGRVWR